MEDLYETMVRYCVRCKRTHGVLECEAYCTTCEHSRGVHELNVAPLCKWQRMVKGQKDIVTVFKCECAEFIPWEDANVPSSN